MFIKKSDYLRLMCLQDNFHTIMASGRVLSPVQLKEYQVLKQFKADCDKDIASWDEGIEVCVCVHDCHCGFTDKLTDVISGPYKIKVDTESSRGCLHLWADCKDGQVCEKCNERRLFPLNTRVDFYSNKSVQKLINKVIEERLYELGGILEGRDGNGDGKKTVPKQTKSRAKGTDKK